jgi:hypothetical protein
LSAYDPLGVDEVEHGTATEEITRG